MVTETVEQESRQPDVPEEMLRGVKSATRQFITFTSNHDTFAVDMESVQEIIRLPEVVRVPLAPPTLDGLANLRGKVLPIISLRRCLDLSNRNTMTPRGLW
jgi:purine-binding chemotaxis protein CheW